VSRNVFVGVAVVGATLLVAGIIAITVYFYHQHQVEAAFELQRQQLADHIRWLNETVTVTLSNPTGGMATLWTATPAGTNPDGSTLFTYNQACSADPHQSCNTNVYDHRGVQVRSVTQYIFLGSAPSPWQAARAGGLTISAYRKTSDTNCCYMSNP